MEVLKLNILFFNAFELHRSVYKSNQEAYDATELYFIELLKKGFTGNEGRIYSNFESFIQAYYRYKNGQSV